MKIPHQPVGRFHFIKQPAADLLLAGLSAALIAVASAGPVLSAPAIAQPTLQDDEGKAASKDENAGLADLDEAIDKKIGAESLEDLQAVAALVESALAKGLDEENTAFARKVLGGILRQQGQAIVEGMLRGQTQGRVQQMRTEALRSFEKAVESDPSLGDAHLQIARLSMLPGGNPKRAFDAASAAVENLKDESSLLSEAYLLRALLQEDEAKRLADLDAAIAADENNTRALQARGLQRLQTGEVDGAVADLKLLMQKDPANSAVAVAFSQALIQLNRREEALEVLDTAITTQPNASLYMLRSELRRLAGEVDTARADMDKAIAMDPNNPSALLLRAESRLRENNVAEAKADVDAAMALQPGNGRGIFLRSLIAAEQERYADAINDMKLLAQNDPENSAWALQLASYYQLDDRPRKAIEIASDILARNPENWQALRLRGDAYLSINEHAEAIADYKAALETPLANEEQLATAPEAMNKVSRSGLANNLAWVMATSPQDALRDGEAAIKFGTEAAELTEYKEAHILSTLAAGYAEAGNFEKAIEWAEKAVAVGEEEGNEQLEQLKSELESYRKGEPWREEQDVEENKIPILSPSEVIDT
ncbi:tetratricopeptide repeat protein [Planctomycetaceae bacterium SH139]